MRKTPYARLRYPWTSDVVSAADVDAMASDIDQQLVTTARMAADFPKTSSVLVSRAAVQSITKNTITAVSFDTVSLNNGANSPWANANWWAAGSPTRLTAPVACVVLASATGGINIGSALGTAGCIQVAVRLNGGGGQQQGSKFNPISTVTGQQWTSALTMWKLAAGDFLEMTMFWTGTPAGPFNTDNVAPPTLALSLLALTSVP